MKSTTKLHVEEKTEHLENIHKPQEHDEKPVEHEMDISTKESNAVIKEHIVQ